MSEFEVLQDADVRIFDNRLKMDTGTYVRFYLYPEQDKAKSEEAGRPIFEEKEYVEIMAPGNANNIVRRRASDMDRQRFPGHYARFKEGMKEQIIGTPLSEVGWITRSQVEELNYLRLRTVEALAAINDSECAKHVGLYDLKRKAVEYLAKNSGESSRLSELEEANKKLQEQINQLLAAKQLPEPPKVSK